MTTKPTNKKLYTSPAITEIIDCGKGMLVLGSKDVTGGGTDTDPAGGGGQDGFAKKSYFFYEPMGTDLGTDF